MYKWADYTIYDTDAGDSVRDFVRVLPSEPSLIQIGKRQYAQYGAGFDIETTRSGKQAYMYHWQFSIGKSVILGRTWDQYHNMMAAVTMWLKNRKIRLIVWVANLGHEFAFLMYRHHWSSIFAKQACQPLRAVTGPIEFRECLSISGQGGLAQLAKKYCKTQKAKGDLDYTIMRNHYTMLTTTEKGYCIADVAILSEFGYAMFHQYCQKPGDKIPMTQTGICRKMVDDAATATGKKSEIYKQMKTMYPKTADQYNYIMNALFRGGYTHANAYYASSDDVNQVIKNVIGYDYTSSYPAVLLHDMCKYPINRFILIRDLKTDGKRITDPRLNLDQHALILNITYYGLKPKTLHSIESDHKIIMYGDYAAEGVQLDNGRVIRADKMTVCQTELDYMIYEKFYTWDRIEIINAQVAQKGPLPRYLLQPLLDAYVQKQQLKAQHLDHTVDYKNAKSIVNSYYGMTVQRLNFVEWKFDQDDNKAPWKTHQSYKPYWKMISDKLLSPYFGIWCTAWARYKLLSVVADLDPDRQHYNVIYCDTDSIYMIDTPRNREIIKKHNAWIHGNNAKLPPECHDLGEFDPIDGGAHYEFKTLGAKRYVKLHDGHAEIVCAGMRRGSYERAFAQETPPDDDYCILKIDDRDHPGRKREMYISKYDLFSHFRDGMLLTVDVADKLYAKYSPWAYSENIGGECMQELSGVALVPIGFKITMADYYKSLILAYEQERRHPVQGDDFFMELDFDTDDFFDADELPEFPALYLGGLK